MRLTYPNDTGKYGGVEPEGSAGGPETEIQITPEMIKAGMDELRLSEPQDSRSGLVRAIYLAMRKARSVSLTSLP